MTQSSARWTETESFITAAKGQKSGADPTFRVSGVFEEASEFLDLLTPVPEERADEWGSCGGNGKASMDGGQRFIPPPSHPEHRREAAVRQVDRPGPDTISPFSLLFVDSELLLGVYLNFRLHLIDVALETRQLLPK